MSHVKPVTTLIALGLFVACAGAFATPTPLRTHATSAHAAPSSTTHQKAYFIAEPGTPNAHRVYVFSRMDRNHDGQLSRVEIPKFIRNLRLQFIQADWNHNSKLSPAEIRMWAQGTVPQYTAVYHNQVFVY